LPGQKGERGITVNGAKGDKGEAGQPAKCPVNSTEEMRSNRTSTNEHGHKGDKGERVLFLDIYYLSLMFYILVHF
jgi:hypothetical protein